jgi:hypothetical protein
VDVSRIDALTLYRTQISRQKQFSIYLVGSSNPSQHTGRSGSGLATLMTMRDMLRDAKTLWTHMEASGFRRCAWISMDQHGTDKSVVITCPHMSSCGFQSSAFAFWLLCSPVAVCMLESISVTSRFPGYSFESEVREGSNPTYNLKAEVGSVEFSSVACHYMLCMSIRERRVVTWNWHLLWYSRCFEKKKVVPLTAATTWNFWSKGPWSLQCGGVKCLSCKEHLIQHACWSFHRISDLITVGNHWS